MRRSQPLLHFGPAGGRNLERAGSQPLERVVERRRGFRGKRLGRLPAPVTAGEQEAQELGTARIPIGRRWCGFVRDPALEVFERGAGAFRRRDQPLAPPIVDRLGGDPLPDAFAEQARDTVALAAGLCPRLLRWKWPLSCSAPWRSRNDAASCRSRSPMSASDALDAGADGRDARKRRISSSADASPSGDQSGSRWS
jgi:hypothetical protein